MHNPQHLVISSNRWYSAATEYALRLCEHLQFQQGQGVEVLTQANAPLAARARSLGLEVRAVSLRRASGKALGVFGFVRLMVELNTILEGLCRGRGNQNQLLVVWVVEGSEHAALCLLRLLGPRWGKRIRLIRLRVQDPNRAGRFLTSWLEVIQAAVTDRIVFPSLVARDRYFATRIKVAQSYGSRWCIQFFGKDSKPTARGNAPQNSDQPESMERADRLLELLQKETTGRVLLAVARFDPIKGLLDLIGAFAGLDPEGRPLTLLICGRKEGLTAPALAAEGARCLGGSVDDLGLGILRVAAPGGLRQLLLVDGHVGRVHSIFDLGFLAIISSLGSEIICRTAVEFLQSGLPVVATNVGSLPEVLDVAQNKDTADACAWLVPCEEQAGASTQARVRCLQQTIQEALAALGHGKEEPQYQARAQRARALGERYALSSFGPLVNEVTK